MKMIATGALGVAILAYFAVSLVPNGGLALGALRSALEAATVGGVADWFAVVALFRHPCGMPIPHTALLPKNQERIAANLGRFVEQHFVDPDEIAAKLGAWLNAEGRMEELAGPMARMLPEAMREGIKTKLVSASRGLIADNRGAIGEHIADVVRTWDPKAMSDLIEDNVGSDLQFIRLNGTFVGGLVGFALFWAQYLLHRVSI